jgi:hypothetical protein
MPVPIRFPAIENRSSHDSPIEYEYRCAEHEYEHESEGSFAAGSAQLFRDIFHIA